MNTTHTPGPWEAKYQPFSPAHTIGKRASTGSLDLIADLSESVAQLDERQANACLIAAAPEMLDALREVELGIQFHMLPLISDMSEALYGHIEPTEPVKLCLDLVRKAIAKAEGR